MALPTTEIRTREQVFVGGVWRDSAGGTPVEVRDPATLRPVGTAVLASAEDVDVAVDSAVATFESGTWRGRPAAERAAVLRRAADHLEGLGDLAVDLLTHELGCVRGFAAAAHVPNPIRHLRYYADLIEAGPAEQIREDGTWRSLVVREPVGVVGAITPWNGPLSSPVLKVAPALAAGCSVVLKPPPETPLTALLLADAMQVAGLPEGALSVLPATREVGEHLVRHPGVDKIAFTGSTAAGKRILGLCADRVARVTLELGGKSAAVVLDDADPDTVLDALLPMAMTVNGQLCIAQSRLLVPRHREAEFTDALWARLQALPVGDPFDPATRIGPLVSAAQRDRVRDYLDLAREEGARVLGGDVPDLPGWFVSPALLAGASNSMRAVREEIFGPVMALVAYDDVDSAVALANDSPYGLSGSVWSADSDRALAVASRIRTGMVSVNGAPQAFGTPFGGMKQSGLGREMGPEGLAAYQELKSIALGRAS
ncbi:aldehyde dehydrogenase [Prauserella cavernicola]|uniref:Aldehyde dehydrogenase n=1 Tax=Prauserella cavernicola TaxID=2800127 RepID=A0A934QXH8_9PSEU|nr:aldehyde dehydrogenase [Prauserella cavernicola]MBK1787324.1 aldehyde dehydrogenase [Prauserella cavernicola]